jgi:hypothetical protein
MEEEFGNSILGISPPLQGLKLFKFLLICLEFDLTRDLRRG